MRATIRTALKSRSVVYALSLFALVITAGCDVLPNPLAIAIDVPDNDIDTNSDGFSLPEDLFAIEAAKVTGGVWDFAVVRTDGGSLDNLIFEWDSDIAGDAHFPEWNMAEWADDGVVDADFPAARRYVRRR